MRANRPGKVRMRHYLRKIHPFHYATQADLLRTIKVANLIVIIHEARLIERLGCDMMPTKK